MKRIFSLILAMAFIVTLASCGKDPEVADDRALVLSSQELDKVFNPFYSSSAPDSQIVGMTQMGMLANDAKGNIVYGEDEGVVVLDYEIVNNPDTTTYNFVLKNNVKFSNGSPLTIKDVLFNLYVYLDPVYTGSSTIYSTDIVGLKEYRTQQADEKAQERFMEQFQIEAESRIDYLLTAAEYIFEDYEDETLTIEEFKEELEMYSEDDGFEYVLSDFEKVCVLFEEELQ